jgi:hypothetical protein
VAAAVKRGLSGNVSVTAAVTQWTAGLVKSSWPLAACNGMMCRSRFLQRAAFVAQKLKSLKLVLKVVDKTALPGIG